MSRRKLSTTVYLTPEQDAALKQLNARTRVPVAEYVRQGIDLVLKEYANRGGVIWPPLFVVEVK